MTDRPWCINDYIHKLYPRRVDGLSEQFFLSSKQIESEIEVTDEALYESYVVMATIIKLYGDQYLPIFERLKAEIDARDERKVLLDKALDIAKASNYFQPE